MYRLKETRSTLCATGTDNKNGRDEVKLGWDYSIVSLAEFHIG